MKTLTLKEKMLTLTYIYRTLPYDYLTTVAKNEKEKEQIRLIVKNLVNLGYLLKKQAKPIPFQYVILTFKGYSYITKQHGSDKLQYSYKEGRLLLKPPYQHSFLNFAYIWHYLKIQQNNVLSETQIFEDSDINKCKVQFAYKGKDVLISPDTIIYMRNSLQRKAIFVENDTGRETYKTIYQKIIEYAALAEEGMGKNKISSIVLYFIFLSEKRLKQLFLSKKGIIRFFDLYNKTNRGLEVRMRYLLKTLQEGNLSIFISAYSIDKPGNPYSFQKYDLAKLLLEKEASWKNFL